MNASFSSSPTTALSFPQLVASFAVGWIAMVCHADAQSTSEPKLTVEYEKAYLAHCQNLKALADKCTELNKPGLAKATLSWVPERDPTREYLFVLPTNRAWQSPSLEDRTDKFWQSYLEKHNKTYAKALFGLAQQANEQGQPELAYRWLHECLFHDAQHVGAANVLGIDHKEFSVKSNTYRQRDTLLPDGDLTKYESDHFQLFTSLDPSTAEKAIAKFERWHIVWRQLFYSYWAPTSFLKKRFETGAKPIRRSKKFKVVLYRDREEYIAKLKSVSPGIEVSVGYYLFPKKTSFFYIGEDTDEGTWVHELTHQFMHESIPVSTRSEIRSSLWAVEGIAMYMESLLDFGTHMTVGGEDAKRLNYCRHNYFRRGFFVEMQNSTP